MYFVDLFLSMAVKHYSLLLKHGQSCMFRLHRTIIF